MMRWCMTQPRVVSTLLSVMALSLGWRLRRIWLLAILLFIMGFAPLASALGSYDWVIDTHHLELEP